MQVLVTCKRPKHYTTTQWRECTPPLPPRVIPPIPLCGTDLRHLPPWRWVAFCVGSIRPLTAQPRLVTRCMLHGMSCCKLHARVAFTLDRLAGSVRNCGAQFLLQPLRGVRACCIPPCRMPCRILRATRPAISYSTSPVLHPPPRVMLPVVRHVSCRMSPARHVSWCPPRCALRHGASYFDSVSITTQLRPAAPYPPAAAAAAPAEDSAAREGLDLVRAVQMISMISRCACVYYCKLR